MKEGTPNIGAVCQRLAKHAPSGLSAEQIAYRLGRPYNTLMSELSPLRDTHKFDVHPAEGAGHHVQRFRGARQPHERYQQVHVELVRVPQGRKLGHQRVVRAPEPIGDLFRRQP